MSADPDWDIRVAALEAIERLVALHGSVLTWSQIEQGFEARGRVLRFANQSKGIFRPAGMSNGALSIKSTVPKRGPRRYTDLASDDVFFYRFQERGADYHDNRLLLRAAEARAPMIYLFGVDPGLYRPIWPAYVAHVDHVAGHVTIVTSMDKVVPSGSRAADPIMTELARRYATAEIKRRLHQDLFRHFVLAAYEERCAICRLSRKELLDASHILPDRDVRGVPSVPNGVALCTLHHRAFDANLVGIRPDLVVEVSQDLMDTRDGPTLESALKGFAGKPIAVPRRASDRPNPQHLEIRYSQFRRAV